jgi:uncharacterized RDD family membrane protein YckC
MWRVTLPPGLEPGYALRVQTAPLDTDVAIETPEHIVFRYRLAGPARRLLAYLIDLVLCYAALTAVALAVVLASVGVRGLAGAAEGAVGVGVGLLLLLLFATQWVYFAALEAWRGTTPGKAALGLRVVTTTGRPIGLRAAALRNVLRAADSLPLTYSLGFLSISALASMSMTKRFQRLGDLVAGTMVVIPERARAAVPMILWPPPNASELAELHDDIRLDPEERQAIEMFLRRRNRLGRARELELAAMIAPLLGARFGSPYTAHSSLAADPSRALALFYDRAANAPRVDPPPSSWKARG